MKLILTIPNEQDAQFVKELLNRMDFSVIVEEDAEAAGVMQQAQHALDVIKNFPLDRE